MSAPAQRSPAWATRDRAVDVPPAPAGGARRGARALRAVALCALAALTLLAPAAAAQAFEHPFIGPFKTVTTVGETVPADGDQNPYGIVNVATSAGRLHAGDVLISNFNNAGSPPTGNLQGTGTTLVELTPRGKLTLFAQIDAGHLPGKCTGGVGLTTALAILPGGYVVVGSLPTSNGQAETAMAGCLLVLDDEGEVVETIVGGPIDGPWDMTAVSEGASSTLFVTNVLNGLEGETPVAKGTVVRIRLHTSPHRPPVVTSESVIASGFPERTDKAALVIGPTGVALGDEGTLYVSDTLGNRIAAVPNALGRGSTLEGGGTTIAAGGYLNNPLGLTLAPNGDILTANANDGDIVETTPAGAEFQPFDTGAGAGGLFGLVVAPSFKGVYFVNDSNNTLGLLH